MGLIAKHYTDPFFCIDFYLEERRLTSFIVSVMEREQETVLWEVWLHKVDGQSYEEFKRKSQVKPVTEEQKVKTITDSFAVFNKLMPKRGDFLNNG